MRITGLKLPASGCFVLVWRAARLRRRNLPSDLAAWNVGPVRGTRNRKVAPAAYEEPVLPLHMRSEPPLRKWPLPHQRSPPLRRRARFPVAANGVRSGPGLWLSDGMAHGGRVQLAATCGTCGNHGPADCDMCCGKPLWWAKFDVLLWWREGRDLPPLVTTDPASGRLHDSGRAARCDDPLWQRA